MRVDDVMMIAAIALLALGVFRDVTQSERDKGPASGPLGGTLRPSSWSGLRSGLPWYLAGGLLFALVVWGR